jgi:hypothetical protein
MKVAIAGTVMWVCFRRCLGTTAYRHLRDVDEQKMCSFAAESADF